MDMPDRWLQRRCLALEQEGYTPFESILVALRQWKEQERLEKALKRILTTKTGGGEEMKHERSSTKVGEVNGKLSKFIGDSVH